MLCCSQLYQAIKPAAVSRVITQPQVGHAKWPGGCAGGAGVRWQIRVRGLTAPVSFPVAQHVGFTDPHLTNT